MSKQRVTLYIDSHLWKAIRLWCVSQGISASKFIEDTMSLRIMETDMPERMNKITPEVTPGSEGDATVQSEEAHGDG